MADTHETITDIIAVKRQRADEIERVVAEKMKRGEMVSDRYARELVADIRREADRLDAAHRRERGDCAKLREALVSLRDAVRDFRHQTVYTKYNDIMDEYTCREKGIPAVLALRDAIPKANLALAATEKEGGAK